MKGLITHPNIAVNMDASALKKIVAEKAVDKYVKDGMNVGLGTGSTAYFAIKRIGELVSGGMKLTCVATSVQSEDLAKECGITVVDDLDVTIDGADEVDDDMNLIKGLGGALVREKIVASKSLSEVIIVDNSKKVDILGMKTPLPVEVLRFGHLSTKAALERLGCVATLRVKDGKEFVTDNGNLIYDCKFESIASPFFLESRIDTIPGVVENGLFLRMATAVLISSPDGSIREMEEEPTIPVFN